MNINKAEIIGKPDTEEDAVIEIEHLNKTFGKDEILKDINLKVKRGETVVTLGKSGTGKSVTLKCIVGLLKPTSGTVFVLGKDVVNIPYKELQSLRKNIGFIFQSGALYDSMSVRENLKFPLIRHEKLSGPDIENRIKEALSDVGLENALNKMPSELSGGMRKRVGLARSLILKPEIMLYDEPTTGLDPATSREISNLILKMQEKFSVTSVVVTHDIECAELTADRIVVLKNGVYSSEGGYDELRKSVDPFVRGFFE